MLSGKVKEKQSAMQESYTAVLDALNALKEEAAALETVWKGEAAELFFTSFQAEWEEAGVQAREAGKLIDAYAQAEKAFECCEEEIAGLL
jgi:uncharacterized protein YukE